MSPRALAMAATSRENQRFADYWNARADVPDDWKRATQTGSAALQLTPDELERLGTEVWALFARYRTATPAEGARRVDVQFRGFPVVDKEGSA